MNTDQSSVLKRCNLEVTVRGIITDENPLVVAFDIDGRQYLLDHRAMGSLWPEVKVNDRLVLEVEFVPNRPTKVFSIKSYKI